MSGRGRGTEGSELAHSKVPTMSMDDTLAERFEGKYMPVPEAGCWIWMACLDGAGYGRIGVGSKRDGTKRALQASRASWMIHRGPIPKGLHVCHTCDVPACVNPDHLFLGTNKDNADDMVRKGRATQGAHYATRTHCANGHEFTPENTATRRDCNGRACRTCGRIATALYRQRKRQQQENTNG